MAGTSKPASLSVSAAVSAASLDPRMSVFDIIFFSNFFWGDCNIHYLALPKILNLEIPPSGKIFILIKFIQENYPSSLPKTRVEITTNNKSIKS